MTRPRSRRDHGKKPRSRLSLLTISPPMAEIRYLPAACQLRDPRLRLGAAPRCSAQLLALPEVRPSVIAHQSSPISGL